MAAHYRLVIALVYNNASNATTALTNINNTLTTAGREEVAIRSGSNVNLTIDGLSESEANTLRVSLTAAWGVGTRSGRVAVSRRDD